MVIYGRVFCNFCPEYIGQLFNEPVLCSDALDDLRKPPFFSLCPACMDSSVVVSDDRELLSNAGMDC